MGCNKNLTDDQLEVMFTASDEEMLKIEQPMEYLIGKTKHKMQEVYQIFLKQSCTQAALLWTSNQKREKSPHFRKTINRINNLEYQLRSCEKAPTHPSNDNYVRQNWMDPLHWRMDPQHWKASKIVESVLKCTALTFRKEFNSNKKKNILQRLKEVIHSMRPAIEGQTSVDAEVGK